MVTDADRGRKAGSVTIPAPTLGLNTRDAWAGMDPRYAVSMVNMIPTPSSVELRKGFALQSRITNSATGQDLNVFQGFVKYGPDGLWIKGTRTSATFVELLEDVFSGTEVTSFDAYSGLGTAYVNFTNPAGSFLIVVGQEYWTYNGAAWTDNSASVTGRPTTLGDVTAHRGRLWFTGLNTTDAYYLPVNALTGALVKFPLGPLMTSGGSLYYVTTWTVDGGEGGADDRIIFVTSAGQVIVYAGTDPSSQSTWALVGVYNLSEPVGRPLRFGPDVLLPMRDGLYSMTEILRGNTGSEYAISSAIRKDWQALNQEGIFYPSKVTSVYSSKFNVVMFNFVTSNAASTGNQTSVQLVMNTLTKGWTKFTGLDAYVIGEASGDIYFANVTGGGASNVYKWGTATDDNGSPITGYCSQAYNYLGSPGSLKVVTGMLPSFTVTGTHTVGFALDADFQQAVTTSTSPTNDQSYAAGSYRQMVHYPTAGDALSIFCEVSSSASGFNWYNTGLLAMVGGVV